MDNLFLEVFPDIKVDNKTYEMLENCRVIKISRSSSSNNVRIFIESDYLIQFRTIEKIVKALSKAYFEDAVVEIVPSFKLSSQYNLMNLWNCKKTLKI